MEQILQHSQLKAASPKQKRMKLGLAIVMEGRLLKMSLHIAGKIVVIVLGNLEIAAHTVEIMGVAGAEKGVVPAVVIAVLTWRSLCRKMDFPKELKLHCVSCQSETRSM